MYCQRSAYLYSYYAGSWKFRTQSNGVYVNGNVYASAYFYTSDVRLKENIETIPNAIAKIKALRGVEFNWKSDGTRDLGMIAQEVQKVIPEVINVEKWVDNSDERTVSEDGVLGPEMPGKPDSWADDDDDILKVVLCHRDDDAEESTFQ